MKDNTSLVCLEDVHASYSSNKRARPLRVLDGINLNVKVGEFVSILGPSGCGKSTLLRVMSGLINPQQGKITWQKGLIEERAERMAMNFQKPVLLPWLNVEENALLPFRITDKNSDGGKKYSSKDLSRLLDFTGLGNFKHALPHELSGGMQMRASLVRTLLPKPRLIFMDEPFAAIDELTRQNIAQDFRQMAKESSAAVVFVTHSLQEAAFLSDRIVVMSPRPAHIVEEVEVAYTQSQRLDSLRRSTDFLDMCDHLKAIMAHG